MTKIIVFPFILFSTVLFSQKTASIPLSKEEIKQRKIDLLSSFPIYKAYEFEDKEGLHELLLCENQKSISKKDTLNTKIQAICVLNNQGNFSEKWQINDLLEIAEPKETTIWFWTKYCSTKDIDGDGYVDPILVYGTRNEDDEIKRLKIITVYKNKKYAIRAVECDLDYCRSFKKDANWNLLPQKVKIAVDKLVDRIRKDQDLLLKDG